MQGLLPHLYTVACPTNFGVGVFFFLVFSLCFLSLYKWIFHFLFLGNKNLNDTLFCSVYISLEAYGFYLYYSFPSIIYNGIIQKYGLPLESTRSSSFDKWMLREMKEKSLSLDIHVNLNESENWTCFKSTSEFNFWTS